MEMSECQSDRDLIFIQNTSDRQHLVSCVETKTIFRIKGRSDSYYLRSVEQRSWHNCCVHNKITQYKQTRPLTHMDTYMHADEQKNKLSLI